MRAETVERLCCPLCHGRFRWTEVEPPGPEIRSAVVHCPSCGIRSEVRDGIGYFLPGDVDLAEGSRRSGRGTPGSHPRTGGGATRWDLSLERTAEFARGSLGATEGPVLQLAGDPIGLAGSPRGSYIIAEDPTGLQSALPSGMTPGAWDGFVVDLHSLPFANHSVEAAIAGPSLLETAGTRVVLRELHRLVRKRLGAVVVVAGGNASTDTPSNGFSEAELLEEFRRANWAPQFVPVDEMELERSAPGSAPERVRWGVVIAE